MPYTYGYVCLPEPYHWKGSVNHSAESYLHNIKPMVFFFHFNKSGSLWWSYPNLLCHVLSNVMTTILPMSEQGINHVQYSDLITKYNNIQTNAVCFQSWWYTGSNYSCPIALCSE